jgi:hypothetical protein
MKMKNIFILIFLVTFIDFSHAQSTLDAASYDFWIGKWGLTWDEGDGKIGRGTNHIEKTLDGTVIQENFRAIDGKSKGFKGTSLSVFNLQTKIWKQAWADNQGGYFDFTGEIEEDKRIFKTAIKKKDDKTIIQRMIFYNISNDSLTWDWQGTQDGGENWNLLWRINYVRSKE